MTSRPDAHSHSPGPWSAVRKIMNWEVNAGETPVCATTTNDVLYGDAAQQANARLISAAPDYDAAAREMAALHDAGTRIPDDVWQKLYDAIAKASGQ